MSFLACGFDMGTEYVEEDNVEVAEQFFPLAPIVPVVCAREFLDSLR